MDVAFFVRGLLIGLAIAAPVGAIGVLCIRRTLAHGRLVGFVSGLGAATADATYGAVAAFGLTSVSSALVGHQAAIRLTGGCFLCYLGVRTFLAQPAVAVATGSAGGLLGAYGSTLALTLTNPTTILSFAAVFAGAGLVEGSNGASAISLVLGVFLGSALWWLVLSGGVGFVRAALDPGRMAWLNRLSGVVLAAFGVVALLSLQR